MNAQTFLQTFDENIRALAAAIDDLEHNSRACGYVYIWPEHHLGVHCEGGKASAVRVDLATRFKSPFNNPVFTNGKGEKAICCSRNVALRRALDHAMAVRAEFSVALAKA